MGHNGFVSFWPVENIFQEENPITFLGLPLAISEFRVRVRVRVRVRLVLGNLI